jgi:hypothetical protein
MICRRDWCRLNRLSRPLAFLGSRGGIATTWLVLTRVLFLDHGWPLGKNGVSNVFRFSTEHAAKSIEQRS